MDETSKISLKRLQTLTDCFFALALILLVVFIEKPPADMKSTEEAIQKYLTAQFDVLVAYLMTFISIIFYWYFLHNEAKYLRRSDNVHVWLTLIALMFVGLLPFSNALDIAFPESTTVHYFYSAVVFCVGLVYGMDWFYATRSDRLVDRSIDPESVEEMIIESLVQPAAALLSLAGAQIGTLWWKLPFLLIPVAIFCLNKLWNHNRSKRNPSMDIGCR